MAVSDSRSASLILVAGAAGVGYWYYHLRHGALAPAAASPGPEVAPGVPQQSAGLTSPLERLEAFAAVWGLRVTSTTGGQHNAGSLHYQGRAIDVSARGITQAAIDRLRQAAAALGIRLLDERQRLPGEPVWSGAHLHLEVPH